MSWELSDGEKVRGPFTDREVIDGIARGLNDATLIRPVGKDEWRNIRAHPAFALALDERTKTADVEAVEEVDVEPDAPAEPAPVSYVRSRVIRRNDSTAQFLALVGAVGGGAAGYAVAKDLLYSRIEQLTLAIVWDRIGEMDLVRFGTSAMGLKLIGCVLVGALVGARTLSLLASRNRYACGACGNPVADQDVLMCPTCRAAFVPDDRVGIMATAAKAVERVTKGD